MQDLRQDPSRQLLQHEARCPDRGQGSSPEVGEEEALLRAFARSRDPLWRGRSVTTCGTTRT